MIAWKDTTNERPVSLAMVIFMFPETKYHRAHPNEVRSSISEASNTSGEKSAHGIFEDTDVTLRPTETAARDPFLGRGKPSRGKIPHSVLT